MELGGVIGREKGKLLIKNMIDATTIKVDHMIMKKRLWLHNDIIDYERLFAR